MLQVEGRAMPEAVVVHETGWIFTTYKVASEAPAAVMTRLHLRKLGRKHKVALPLHLKRTSLSLSAIGILKAFIDRSLI